MIPFLRSALLTGLLLLTAGAPAALAQENREDAEPGRYQAVLVSHPGGESATTPRGRVLILDTRDGHLWLWSENEALYGKDGRPEFGTVLLYQGQVRPGRHMGDIIERADVR